MENLTAKENMYYIILSSKFKLELLILILIIIAAVRQHSGVYSCRVTNTVGASSVIDILNVYVEDVPSVRLKLLPRTPIR